MFLLDSKAAGAFLRRRLRVGCRRCGKGGKVALDVSVAVGLPVGECGIHPFCRPLSRPVQTTVSKAGRPPTSPRPASMGCAVSKSLHVSICDTRWMAIDVGV